MIGKDVGHDFLDSLRMKTSKGRASIEGLAVGGSAGIFETWESLTVGGLRRGSDSTNMGAETRESRNMLLRHLADRAIIRRRLANVYGVVVRRFRGRPARRV
jgi:hypothetical protein